MTATDLLLALGRAIFGAFFLIAGLRNFVGFRQRVETSATNYGWKLPVPLLAAGFAIQSLGGLALLLNVWIVPAVVALIVFLVLATSLYHNALAFPRGQRDLHIYLILVNVTLAGGLLMIVAGALPPAR